MLRLLSYLISKGVCTSPVIPELLSDDVFGMPAVTEAACAAGCNSCIEGCPTNAITKVAESNSVTVDRGRCISCQQCVSLCQSGSLVNDRSTGTWAYDRSDLISAARHEPNLQADSFGRAPRRNRIFDHSLSIRVVSTGCSACDLEMAAASNPIFDMERFGINVVASPRFADVLLVTGPAPKSMHEALLSCYKAMAEPKVVVACGTCAISGGVHAHGYAEANGVSAVLPVDVFIPGCPPHPWQLIRGILALRKLPAVRPTSKTTTVQSSDQSARQEEISIPVDVAWRT